MRRYLILLICVWQSLWLCAQEFTTLDWSVLRIDSVLPVYTEVVPLETDYRRFSYSVQIDYPQYAELTAAETEVAKKFAHSLSDTLKVDHRIGVQRGEGMLDISFVPVVCRNQRYYKLQSARIRIVPRLLPQASLAARKTRASATASSVLASGKWVKISVTQDGIHQLTRQALRKMGFSKPENVRLYGYGGHRIDETLKNVYEDLEEVPLYYNATHDNWLFWANGLLYWDGNERVFNPYANEACYFLTEADSPSALATAPAPIGSVRQTYESFTDHLLYEKDDFAWFTVGRNLYDAQNFSGGGSRTYKFTTVNSLGNELLTVAFTAGAESRTTLKTTVNGNALPEQTLSATSKYIYATAVNRTTDVSKYAAGADWSVRLSSTSGNDARLDYLSLHYTRRLALSQGQLAFRQNGSGVSAFRIEAPEGSQVMRIGTPGRAAELIPTNRSGDILTAVVDNPKERFVCFDPSYASFPQPTARGAVENQNLHALDSLDMVIIVPTSGKLTAQAQRLADAHAAHDGLRSVVVRADQVYNEFSSGTPDATAYRRLMKMLYDRASSKDEAPRYLILMGDCAWDNRMLSPAWRNANADDYLLCFESENSMSDTRSYIMEDYFGLLDDGEGGNLLSDKADLGIGRFPVTTAAQAAVMVDKCIAYMENRHAGAWKNVVCMMGDDGDENEHMKYADDVCDQMETTNPQMEVRKVMWDAYTRVSTAKSNTYPEVESLLRKQVEDGALVMNYTGHANASALSHEYVLELDDFTAFRGTALPLWVTAACDVMPFDGTAPNIGEEAVLNPSGAALAFYGTTRTVYAIQNRTMNLYFMKYLFGTDSKGRRYTVGDAIRLAKNAIITAGESSQKENKLQYALLGDPALVIGAPLQRVVVDSINGKPAATASDIRLQAGSRVRVSGHVNGADRQLLSAFQGVVSCRVYDTSTQVTCNNNAGATNAFTFTDRSSLLFDVKDSVRQGRFSISFTVPVDIHYDDGAGRMVFYALSDDRATEANGYSENFTLSAAEHELTDTIGPDIMAFLGDEEFQDGDAVPCQPHFIALLEDESGVNVSGNGIGHDLSLCVDGRADLTFNLNGGYQGEFGDPTRGSVGFTLPQLQDGPHSLTFRAWDVLNNTSTATLNFVVNSRLKPQLMQLTASPQPAVESTTFMVAYDRPGADCTFTLEVFDFSGRKLWSHTATTSTPTGLYTVPWNLTTSQGGRLGSGIYLYRCTLQSGSAKEVSKTQKIVVLNNK